MSDASFYVHIPFCARRCDFCAFYAEPLAGGGVNEFLGALVRELEQIVAATSLTPRTIFFGGGTPSLLTARQFETLLAKMRVLGLLGEALDEFTLEAAPATITPTKARLWRDHGVNRVSLGAQSLDDGVLKRLGSPHTASDVNQSFDLLRRAGFDNLNLDLIFAVPDQTLAQWRETLEKTIALGPEHISTYELTYEEGSVLTAQRDAGAVRAIDDETAAAMHELRLETLAAAGYQQYEIANFARPATAGKAGRRCAHNLNYWLGGDCVAVGPSAAGYWHGTRTKNIPDLDLYINRVVRGERPVAFAETLPPRQRAGELAAFALRMNDGIRADWFAAKTGFTLEELWAAEIAELRNHGLATFDGCHLRLSRRGQLVADSVAERFVVLPAEEADERVDSVFA